MLSAAAAARDRWGGWLAVSSGPRAPREAAPPARQLSVPSARGRRSAARGRSRRLAVACAVSSLALAPVLAGRALDAAAPPSATPPGDDVGAVPFGLPAVPVPEDLPVSAERIALGRRLFFEPALSSDGTVSCASCHVPANGFADEVDLSLGVEGQPGHRNAPSIFNAAYFPVLFWDGRSTSLEDQVRYPLTDPKEMNQTMAGAVAALESEESYGPLFAAAFGDPTITYERIAQAIASYERTLLSGDSPFDRFYFGGREDELSPEARRGWELFGGRAGCISCHHFDADRPFFSDFEFHNTGIGWDRETVDLGRFKVTRDPEDRGRFRTPSLRNVAQTAPYMHDGRFRTMEEVLAFYAEGGGENPFLDPAIRPLDLSPQDRADLVAFLLSLTGSAPPEAGRKETSEAATGSRGARQE